MNPTLFHLHFNTPDVDGAADRLARRGVGLTRRFGTVRGDGVSLAPEETPPDGFRFKLQVHRRGRVDITLAPGRRPRFDHVGLIVDAFEPALDRAESRGWSVRRNERRTFVMTPWRFRVELHPSTGDVATALGSDSECRMEDAVLRLSDADRRREAFDDVFGSVPQLRIERGEELEMASFSIVTDRTRRDVDVSKLLGE